MYAARGPGTTEHMTDLGDPQDRAEALDADRISDEYEDAEGALAYPPDRATGVNQYGTTAAEERVPEAPEERARRDTRDPLAEISEPSEEELSRIEAEDVENELVAAEEAAEELSALDDSALDDLDGSGFRVGRLVEPGADDDGEWNEDVEPDAVALRADEDQADLTAEEDAIHLTQDPPFGRLGDGYIDADGDDPDDDIDED